MKAHSSKSGEVLPYICEYPWKRTTALKQWHGQKSTSHHGSIPHGVGRGKVVHMSCSPHGAWQGKVLRCRGPARCRAELQHLGLEKPKCSSEHPSLHLGYIWSREGGSAHGKEKGQPRHPQSDLKVQGREAEGGGKSSANISTCLIGFTAWYLAQHAHFVDNYRVRVQNFVERISHPKTSMPLKS